MRALAEFVMRGRTQAIAVATLAVSSQLLAIVGVAVVGLVTLRRGAKDGLIVMMWAQLPALLFALMFADISNVLALIGIVVAALILRTTRRWPLALMVAVVAGVIAAMLFNTAATGYVQQWIVSANEVFADLSRRGQQGAVQLPQLSSTLVSGALGWGVSGYVVLSLLLARWWQALLYNPGGFRSEFHQLRLPPVLALGLTAAAIGVSSSGGEYLLWAVIFTMPLGIAGLALVHGVVGSKGFGRGALIATYLLLLLVAWFKLVLLLLALIDSFVNFRARITPRASS